PAAQQPAAQVARTPEPTVSADARALSLLETRVRGDRLYPDDCIRIVSESDAQTPSQSFDFAVRERHGDGCPGDPQTSPVRDRFRVQADGHVLWYDVVNADFVDYAERARSLQ
ncbi:hypothetical protein, partial [Xanthomonas maliensis]